VKSTESSGQLEPYGRSIDGYIRMTFSRFLALAFVHRVAWIDDSVEHDLPENFPQPFQAGYCEWSTDTGFAPVSLGWAWFREGPETRLLLAPGGISSNLMLTNPQQCDLGVRQTQVMLESWLHSEDWQPSDLSFGLAAISEFCITAQ
jgi:Domain of unknown function (DUF4902)